MTFLRNNLPDPATYFESQGLTLEGGGKWRTTRCEFHGGRDSMRVNLENGAWVCMAGCGAKGGDVLAYQMQINDQPFILAAKVLGAWQDDPFDESQPRNKPLPFSARDALSILSREATLVAVAVGNAANGVDLTGEDLSCVCQAVGRIRLIAETFE